MDLDIYAGQNYKETLKLKLKELQGRRKDLTLRKLATQIPLQYTYLSKILKDSKVHLNEDHLYKICTLLEIMPEEMEFLQLQRSFEMAADLKRKSYLDSKIESLRKARRLNVDIQSYNSGQINGQMAYLLNPVCVVVHVSLHIKAFQKDPKLLCSKLGMTLTQLEENLRILDQGGFIELGESGLEVKSIKDSKLHFGREHPLMRIHQYLLKTAIHSQLSRTEEKHKHSLLATLSMDQNSFEKIKEEFQIFIKKVEEISSKAKDEQVYQINFDLFRWV